jgi:hypothetical protein
MKTMMRTLANWLMAIWSLAAMAQQTRTLSAPLPACSQEQQQYFDLLRETQGISGVDPDGGHIDVYAARERVLGLVPRDHRPFLEYKQTFCGKLDHFYWFHFPLSFQEQDWNNVVVPGKLFMPMFEDAKRLLNSAAGLPECNAGAGQCLEIEITPGKEGYRNLFFDKKDLDDEKKSSPLQGRELCFYGPWVNDEVHGVHPEIHPSELIWWQDQATDPNPGWWLLTVTDKSGRFADRSHFPGAPQNERWLPWAAKPRHSRWRFLIDQPDDSILQEVSLSSSLDTTGLTDLDVDANSTVTLNLGNTPMFAVHKSDLLVKGMKVGFGPMCVDARDGHRKGYAEMEIMVGAQNPGKPGFAMLRLIPGPQAQERAALGDAEDQSLIYVANSLRMQKGGMVADLQRTGPVEESRFSMLAVIPKKSTAISPGCRALAEKCVSATVMSRKRPESNLMQAAPSQPSLPLSIIQRPTARRQVAVRLPGTANKVRERRRELRGSRSIHWVRASRVTLDTSFIYVAKKQGRPSPEDEAEVMQELNKKFEGQGFRAFLGAFPFAIEQQEVTAMDETTGTSVPARSGEPPRSDAEASAILTHVAGNNWKLDVIFPKANPDHLYKVEYRASVHDQFGNEGVIEQEVWNHQLQLDRTAGSTALTDQLLRLAGLDPGVVRQDAVIDDLPPEFWGLAPQKKRRAQMVLERAREIAETMTVASFDDIEKLLNLVQLYSGNS